MLRDWLRPPLQTVSGVISEVRIEHHPDGFSFTTTDEHREGDDE